MRGTQHCRSVVQLNFALLTQLTLSFACSHRFSVMSGLFSAPLSHSFCFVSPNPTFILPRGFLGCLPPPSVPERRLVPNSLLQVHDVQCTVTPPSSGCDIFVTSVTQHYSVSARPRLRCLCIRRAERTRSIKHTGARFASDQYPSATFPFPARYRLRIRHTRPLRSEP